MEVDVLPAVEVSSFSETEVVEVDEAVLVPLLLLLDTNSCSVVLVVGPSVERIVTVDASVVLVVDPSVEEIVTVDASVVEGSSVTVVGRQAISSSS